MTCLCGDSQCPSCGLAQGTLDAISPDQDECLGCGRPFNPDLVGDCDESDYCESCLQNQAEAAYERQVGNFYGSGEPLTMNEICRAAWDEKRRLR